MCDGDSDSDNDELNEGLDLQEAELEFINEEHAMFLFQNTDVSAFVTLESSPATAVTAPESCAENLAIETVQFAPSQPSSDNISKPSETNYADIAPVQTVSEKSISEDVSGQPAASVQISVFLPEANDGEKISPKTNPTSQRAVSAKSPTEDVPTQPTASTSQGISVDSPEGNYGEKVAPKSCYEVLQTLNKPKNIAVVRKRAKVKKPSVISSSNAIQQRLDIIKGKEKLKEEKEFRKQQRENRRNLKTPPSKKKRDDSFIASSTPTSYITDNTTSPGSGFTPPRKAILRKKRKIDFTESDSD